MRGVTALLTYFRPLCQIWHTTPVWTFSPTVETQTHLEQRSWQLHIHTYYIIPGKQEPHLRSAHTLCWHSHTAVIWPEKYTRAAVHVCVCYSWEEVSLLFRQRCQHPNRWANKVAMGEWEKGIEWLMEWWNAEKRHYRRGDKDHMEMEWECANFLVTCKSKFILHPTINITPMIICYIWGFCIVLF